MGFKVVVASDSFKGSLSSEDVIRAVEKAAASLDPSIIVQGIAIADGGEGTLAAIERAVSTRRYEFLVEDSLGRNLTAGYITIGQTAIIEMAQVCGLTQLTEQERNPLFTSSYGLGQLIAHALDNPLVGSISIAIGGSSTNDAGVGMAQALGFDAMDMQGNPIGRGGINLGDLHHFDCGNVHPRLHKVPITVMCDVQNPLLGEQGATHVYAPQKGATLEAICVLERNMRHVAKKYYEFVLRDVANVPGSGAAGGTAAGLLTFCGATLVPGIDVILDLVEFERFIADADLIITGEGRTDSQTKNGKVVLGVARRALRLKKSVVCISGALSDDIDYLYGCGVTAVFSLCTGPMSQANAMKDAANLLTFAASNVLRLYQRSIPK